MSTVVLVFGIVSVVLTAAVLFRGRNIGPFIIPYFFVGWIGGELALHIVVIQAVAAIALVAAGGTAEPKGVVGLLLLVISWVGLAVAQFRASRAVAVLRRAIGEGFATADEVPGQLGAVRTFVPWAELVNPFRMRRPGVEVAKDIAYGDAGERNLLDVYRPVERNAPLPVLLQIHGGGWTIGDKREQAKPLMNLLAANGWACVAANYRLSPKASFPDHIVDVKRAIAWIREHGPDYGLDPSFIAITGGSAGGHLSSLAALTANDPEFQPGFEDVDTSLSACVPFYGIYDFLDRDGAHRRQSMEGFLEKYVMKVAVAERREAWEKASPVSHVRADAPPFFVIHGTHDSLALVENARTFVDALREVAREPVLYAELPGAQHAFEVFHSVRTGHTINAVHRFLENVYARFRLRREAGGERIVAAP